MVVVTEGEEEDTKCGKVSAKESAAIILLVAAELFIIDR